MAKDKIQGAEEIPADAEALIEANMLKQSLATEIVAINLEKEKESLKRIQESARFRIALLIALLVVILVGYSCLIYVGYQILFAPGVFQAHNDIWHVQAVIVLALAAIPTLILVILVRVIYSPIDANKDEIKYSDAIPPKAVIDAMYKPFQ